MGLPFAAALAIKPPRDRAETEAAGEEGDLLPPPLSASRPPVVFPAWPSYVRPNKLHNQNLNIRNDDPHSKDRLHDWNHQGYSDKLVLVCAILLQARLAHWPIWLTILRYSATPSMEESVIS